MSPIDRNPEPEVLWEDNHLIALRKPAGMLTQGDETGDLSLFDWTKEYIRVTYNKPGNVYLGLLHRLDRPTGGIVLMAKTSKAASRMTKKFQDRKVEKTYLAVVKGVPRKREDHLLHYVAKVPGKTNIMRAYPKPGEGRKKAELDYLLLEEKKGLSLLEVQLGTGRKHQIRLQLAAIGHPVLGDMKYAKIPALPDRSIALYANKLRFRHPIGEAAAVSIEAQPPGKHPWTEFQLGR
jgi:23S rRNA pseudouridine1911/1915/1917 synthase